MPAPHLTPPPLPRRGARSPLLAALLAACAPTPPDPGTPDDPVTDSDPAVPCAVTAAPAPMHRVSRVAFDRALRDVFGLDDHPGLALPADTVSAGFSTTSSAQAVGGAWLAGAFRIAGDVAARVMAPRAWSTAVELDATALIGDRFEVANNEPGTWVLVAFPQTVRTTVDVPEDGTYTLALRASMMIDWTDIGDPPDGTPPSVRLVVDEVEAAVFTVDDQGFDDVDQAVALALDAGPHAVRLELTVWPPYDLQLDRLAVDRVAVTLADRATPLRDRLVTCDPYVDDPGPCVDAIVAPVARRLWRRPLTADETASLRALVLDAPDVDDGLTAALHRLIASPDFLFLPELPGDRALTAWEVGARLADVLWAGVPDDALLDCAAAGGLGVDDDGPCGLLPQVGRLLADPRSDAVGLELVDGWLGTTDLATTLSPEARPSLDRDLVAAFAEEPRRFVADALARDLPLASLVNADHAVVDATLAAFYGLPAPPPGTWATVATDGRRGGVLTQGAWLASTSEAARTSPVRRGVWVLAQLLCDPPGEPPVVPPLDGDVTDPRAALDRHVNDPACRACHATIDPIGLALETFDQDGDVRPGAVDATGTMPDGTTVDGPVGPDGLAAWVVGHDAYARCMATQLSTWALRRALGPDDACLIDQLGADADAGLATTLRALLASPAFLRHREATP